MPAPIAVFAFNRPDHLRRTLAALAANTLAPDSAVTIFCDGPRTGAERALTEATRAVAREARGFASLDIVEQETNLGLARSVIQGLGSLFARHDAVIDIEDDILTSPHTLTFLNRCLETYRDVPAVFNIAAWSFPRRLMPLPRDYPYDVYFTPRFNCWGWATWRDRWETVDWDVKDYDVMRRGCLRRAFAQGGSDLPVILDAQMRGAVDTWDVQMDFARFKQGRLGLNPVYSYTTNIGFGSGTHCTEPITRLDNDVSLALEQPRLPDFVFTDAAVLRAYRKAQKPHLATRIINRAWRTVFGTNLIRV